MGYISPVMSVMLGHKVQDFLFLPDFFSESEQKTLLAASLQKLDSTESRDVRRRRKKYLDQVSDSCNPSSSHSEGLFLPDEYYSFEEGHYDGVIRNYREMHVSSWPEGYPDLPAILNRLRSIHPNQPTQTHILHLASDGEILSHVDNVEASGSWILGVSLGTSRVLRLENVHDISDAYEILLPSGSVYLQKDSIRYGFRHSILKNHPGQRLSIMIRDLFRRP